MKVRELCNLFLFSAIFADFAVSAHVLQSICGRFKFEKQEDFFTSVVRYYHWPLNATLDAMIGHFLLVEYRMQIISGPYLGIAAMSFLTANHLRIVVIPQIVTDRPSSDLHISVNA